MTNKELSKNLVDKSIEAFFNGTRNIQQAYY